MADGWLNRKATTASPAVTATSSATSRHLATSSRRLRAHSRIGPPTTSTAMPSPAHHCSTMPGHQLPPWATTTLAPIRPPASGPSATAPATNLSRSARTVRSGMPRQNQRAQVAPTTGSTAFAAAEPSATSNRHVMLQVNGDLADDDRGDDHRPAPPGRQQQGGQGDARRREAEGGARAEALPGQLGTSHVRCHDDGEQPPGACRCSADHARGSRGCCSSRRRQHVLRPTGRCWRQPRPPGRSDRCSERRSGPSGRAPG